MCGTICHIPTLRTDAESFCAGESSSPQCIGQPAGLEIWETQIFPRGGIFQLELQPATHMGEALLMMIIKQPLINLLSLGKWKKIFHSNIFHPNLIL